MATVYLCTNLETLAAAYSVDPDWLANKIDFGKVFDILAGAKIDTICESNSQAWNCGRLDMKQLDCRFSSVGSFMVSPALEDFSDQDRLASKRAAETLTSELTRLASEWEKSKPQKQRSGLDRVGRGNSKSGETSDGNMKESQA